MARATTAPLRPRSPLHRAIAAALIATTLLAPTPGLAQVSVRPALTDRPLMSTGTVKPNIMFTLDTSTTMGMPWVSNALNPDPASRRWMGVNSSNYGESPSTSVPIPAASSLDVGGTNLSIANDPTVYSPSVNNLWYDNTRTYTPGVHWNGTPLPNVDPTRAPYEGYRTARDPDGVVYWSGADASTDNIQYRAIDLTRTCEAWNSLVSGPRIALTPLQGRLMRGKSYPAHLGGTGYVFDSTREGRLDKPGGGPYFGDFNYNYDEGTYCTWSMGSYVAGSPTGLPTGRDERGDRLLTVTRYAFWYRYVPRSGNRWIDLDGSSKVCTDSGDHHQPWCLSSQVCDGSAETLRDPKCYQRIDIMKPGVTAGESKSDVGGNARSAYPKAATRTDCRGSTCTYEEEIQNYANWFSYYRMRQTAMKTHLGRQFAAIAAGSAAPFRIGFNTTTKPASAGGSSSGNSSGWMPAGGGPSSGGGSNSGAGSNSGGGAPNADFNDLMQTDASANYLFLEVNDWTEAHKKEFFRNFYGTGLWGQGDSPYPVSTTVKIGDYFRGKGAKDPMKFSCQPAMHVFATDTANLDRKVGPTTSNAFPAIDQPYAGNNNGDLDGHPGNPLATRASASIDTTGQRNQLSDATMFYASKDLRSPAQGNCVSAVPGIELCADNVIPSAKSNVRHQHMRSSVIGIGFEGKPYREDYETSTDPANPIFRIKNGLDDWFAVAVNRPEFGQNQWKTLVDDYWHAAINGRGTFFNPRSISDLSRALSAVLGDLVSGSPASAAGSVVSTPVLVSGQQAYSYGVRFFPGEWTGDVYRRKIDPITGGDIGGDEWNTRDLIDALAAGNGWNTRRKIVTMLNGAGVPFRANKLDAAQLKALAETNSTSLWGNLTTAQKDPFGGDIARFREAVVDYLRGDRTHEVGGSGAQVFRKRARLLGDIVGSEAVYVAKPRERYTDATNPGYAAFVTGNESRRPLLYVAANDGMLHAIDGETGQEEWAYIPGVIIDPTKGGLNKAGLGELAFPEGGVPPFAKQFYADGTPVVSDVDFDKTVGGTGSSPEWRSILVAGLNKGGSGIYALDVTSGATPGSEGGVASGKVLWEFNGDRAPGQLGYTFGKPIVTKTRAWGWVVIVSSGMSNTSGKGAVYVLNARTGEQLFRFIADEGSDVDPTGLSYLAGYSASFADGTVEQVYGADLRGNVWRFDLSGASAPTDNKGVKVATLTDPGRSPQPQAVTTRMRVEFDAVSGKRWLFVGTGRMLDASDADPTALASTQTQTFYAIPDGDRYTPAPVTRPLTRADLTNVTNSLDGDTVNAKNGWYEDFQSGERVMVDPRFDVGVILYAASKPSDDQCSSGFSSRLFARKVGDARSVLFEGTGSTRLRSLTVPEGIVKIDTVTLASGETVARLTTVTGEGRGQRIENPRDSRGLGRVSWREITTD